jgi:hypothetical protein
LVTELQTQWHNGMDNAVFVFSTALWAPSCRVNY